MKRCNCCRQCLRYSFCLFLLTGVWHHHWCFNAPADTPVQYMLTVLRLSFSWSPLIPFQVGFSQKEGSPIIHARVSGNFAFVECRSIEETTALLNLNNIPFLGQVSSPLAHSRALKSHVRHDRNQDLSGSFSTCWRSLEMRTLAGKMPKIRLVSKYIFLGVRYILLLCGLYFISEATHLFSLMLAYYNLDTCTNTMIAAILLICFITPRPKLPKIF